MKTSQEKIEDYQAKHPKATVGDLEAIEGVTREDVKDHVVSDVLKKFEDEFESLFETAEKYISMLEQSGADGIHLSDAVNYVMAKHPQSSEFMVKGAVKTFVDSKSIDPETVREILEHGDRPLN